MCSDALFCINDTDSVAKLYISEQSQHFQEQLAKSKKKKQTESFKFPTVKEKIVVNQNLFLV